jgi:hypothetical protein
MFLVLSILGWRLQISFGKAESMSLKSLTDRATANGVVIDAAIAAGIGAAPIVLTGTTDAQLDVVENIIAAQDAKLQAAIDAAGTGGPTPPGIPGNAPKVVSIDVTTIAAGQTMPVVIKGSGFTGGSVVGTGGLSFANAVVVDDSTITVDVTAGATPGPQQMGVAVGSATSNELPVSIT